MIVSVNGREKKIAILDNGRVSEFYIERGEADTGVAGNIYKGRVQRVLPGMQSAFVAIGLERDAFLYVSDFFDEEEEIERIVSEKSKKGSAEAAKREAREQVERARVEREKQMESVQELAEPIVDAGIAEKKDGRHRKESRSAGVSMVPAEIPNAAEPPDIEFDDTGFERVVDDEDTGELFKDAYLQEAIVDKVRAIEFDVESTASAEVGSLLDSVGDSPSQFQRIADEEDAVETERPKKKTRTRKSGSAADKTSKPKKTTRGAKASAASGKSKTTRKKKSDPLPDAEATVKDSKKVAEMAVRRGGRGRRRGGRGRKQESAEATSGLMGFEDIELDVGRATSDDVAVDATDGTGDNVEQSSKTDVSSDDAVAPEQGRQREGRRGRGRDRRDKNGRGERPRSSGPTISDLLREGQEILVQIAKEPIARKGARITSHIALPGRFLVYMPTIEHLGVSRKIESANERGRLRALIQKIRQEEDIASGGFIVRTAGVGITDDDIRHDARYLVRTWQEAKKKAEKVKPPALVHQDLDLVQRILRDQLSDEFTAIRVDSEEEFQRTVEFINRIQPKMVKRVKLYTRAEPILDYYGVQEEIDKALKPRVWLRSGGYLVINQTEALVAIDVNTGKFVGKGNARLEDTIVKTNLEAVDEIARQIRLRDLGGIIVLDLIDMEDRKNRHKVYHALQEALSHDKSPTKVLSFNDFGLIIMTRKRVKQSLERTMCAPCENCEGSGWVKSPHTVCYEILAEARRLSKQMEDVRHTTLRIHPEVAKVLRSTEREVFEEIENYLGDVDIDADPHIHQAQFDFAFI